MSEQLDDILQRTVENFVNEEFPEVNSEISLANVGKLECDDPKIAMKRDPPCK